jgi:hypothetical protein
MLPRPRTSSVVNLMFRTPIFQPPCQYSVIAGRPFCIGLFGGKTHASSA